MVMFFGGCSLHPCLVPLLSFVSFDGRQERGEERIKKQSLPTGHSRMKKNHVFFKTVKKTMV
jgi:hypothetical protein